MVNITVVPEEYNPDNFLYVRKNWFEAAEKWAGLLFDSLQETKALLPVSDYDCVNYINWDDMPEKPGGGHRGPMGKIDPNLSFEMQKQILDSVRLQNLNDVVKLSYFAADIINHIIKSQKGTV